MDNFSPGSSNQFVRDQEMKVDIVIVNWNSGDYLRNCINSIAKYGDGRVGHTIVVDNGSEDGSDSTIEHLPGISLIRAGENLGFGKACNVGAHHANSKYLLFLNPDAELRSGSLTKAVAHMEATGKEGIGICGVQLIGEDGQLDRSCARFPTLARFAANAIGIDRLFPRLGREMLEWDHSHTSIVDQVIGAFFIVRRELFESLGGFDERFFVYFEEVDFALRASQEGFRTIYLADAQAFHVGGAISKQVKARRLFYSLRSRLLYSFKHFSWIDSFGVLLLTLFVEPLSRSVLVTSRRSWSGFRETWLAYGMLWRWLPDLVTKRENFQSSR